MLICFVLNGLGSFTFNTCMSNLCHDRYNIQIATNLNHATGCQPFCRTLLSTAVHFDVANYSVIVFYCNCYCCLSYFYVSVVITAVIYTVIVIVFLFFVIVLYVVFLVTDVIFVVYSTIVSLFFCFINS